MTSAGAVVQITDANGNIYVFDGPPCSDWALSGSTCIDILAVAAPGPGVSLTTATASHLVATGGGAGVAGPGVANVIAGHPFGDQESTPGTEPDGTIRSALPQAGVPIIDASDQGVSVDHSDALTNGRGTSVATAQIIDASDQGVSVGHSNALTNGRGTSVTTAQIIDASDQGVSVGHSNALTNGRGITQASGVSIDAYDGHVRIGGSIAISHGHRGIIVPVPDIEL